MKKKAGAQKHAFHSKDECSSMEKHEMKQNRSHTSCRTKKIKKEEKEDKKLVTQNNFLQKQLPAMEAHPDTIQVNVTKQVRLAV